jgi:nucleoid-associated protein YgaU
MKKEYKIGMFVALVVIFVVIVTFAMHKGNGIEQRESARPVAEPNLIAAEVNAPPRFDANSATPLPGMHIDANAPAATSSQPSSIGGSSSAVEQTEPIETQKFYVVRKGDTLSSISQKYYGNTKKSSIDKIFEANRSVLKSKNSLKPGMKLTIPK